MKTILKEYKHFHVSLQKLKSVLGEDLFNVTNAPPEKVCASDVVFAIR